MMRIFSNSILLVSVFFLPPTVTFLLLLACTFIFDTFLESIAWAFVLDILYGAGGFMGIHFQYIFTLVAVIFFFSSFRLKKMLKFYHAE